MLTLKSGHIELFADGGDIEDLRRKLESPIVDGVTTNPSLIRSAGVTDYRHFCAELAELPTSKPISIEVLCDDLEEMRRQALQISALSENFFVKIPVVNSKGVSTRNVVRNLIDEGVNVNVTAIFTLTQVEQFLEIVSPRANLFLSLFCGRIADAGVDAREIMMDATRAAEPYPNVKFIWASTRQVYNVVEAVDSGCHIITMTDEVFQKLGYLNKDLTEWSKETAAQFVSDAIRAGYSI